MLINITIKEKIAKLAEKAVIICGNSDYIINCSFDDEWAQYKVKTARIICNGKYTDVVFEGNSFALPTISNATGVFIGVFAGDLHTTTPAFISAEKSILCSEGTPSEPTPDVYAQIMEMMNDGRLKGDKGDKGDQGEQGEQGESGVYTLGEGETLEDVPEDADVVIDPNGTPSGDVDLEGVLKYTQQELTDEQKTQARENIGAVDSWNDLKDKPFGEISETGGDTVYYDGELREPYVDLGKGMFLVKVSDAVPTVSDLEGKIITILTNELGVVTKFLVSLHSPLISVFDDGCILIDFILIIPTDNYVLEDNGDTLVFPNKGVYFYNIDDGYDAYISAMTIPDYTGFSEIKKIDSKYIPDNIMHKYEWSQPDWNQNDVEHPAYINNKPIVGLKNLGSETENGVNYLTDNGVRITYAEFTKIANNYGVNRITVNTELVVARAYTNDYIICATAYIDGSEKLGFSIKYRYYRTAEYVPTETEVT